MLHGEAEAVEIEVQGALHVGDPKEGDDLLDVVLRRLGIAGYEGTPWTDHANRVDEGSGIGKRELRAIAGKLPVARGTRGNLKALSPRIGASAGGPR